MIKQLAVWKLIAESIQKGIPAMLLYVLQSEGSSPGRQGFAMAVNLNGDMAGSIGGGIMEHKLVEMAKDILSSADVEISIRKQIHDKSAAKDQSGMICSGQQTIALMPLNQKNLDTVGNIFDSLLNNKNGTIRLSPEGLFFSKEIPGQDYLFDFYSQSDWKFEEKIGYKNHLYVIGSGHCAVAVCQIMSTLDFYIHLYDDRLDLNTFAENSFAHEKIILKDYAQLQQLVPAGMNSYVLVMTVGYRTDDIAVRALIEKKFKYFGVLGSKAKMVKLMGQYKEAGLSEECLNKIHSPVGIQINSQSPEEIAISIAAEIISVKNGNPQLS